MRGGFSGEADAKKEVRRSKARLVPERLKPDAAAGLNRNATTSACVGWDKPNIENQLTLRKECQYADGLQPCSRKRLHDHQDHDSDH